MKIIDTPYTRIGVWFSLSWPWIRPVFKFRAQNYTLTDSSEDIEIFEQCFEVASR